MANDGKWPVSEPQEEPLKDSGDQSLPRFTEDDLAKNIHSLGAKGEPLSQENHEFLADYHRRKARAMRPEGAYDGMDED